jgi:predicted O-methyltransferase YrrM
MESLMGFFWEGLPPYVLDWARELIPEGAIAIETGTFRGDTSILLADTFGSCVTIERSPSLAAAAKERFSNDERIQVIEGNSRDVLSDVLPKVDVPCFLWLDAHGIYDYVGEDDQENPILEEIEVVARVRLNSNTVIVIDDARGMGTQPGWPALSEILTLFDRHGYEVVGIDDVLVAVSKTLKPNFWSLYQSSRMVEASAVFQIWPRVIRATRNRARGDRIVGAAGDIQARFLKK